MRTARSLLYGGLCPGQAGGGSVRGRGLCPPPLKQHGTRDRESPEGTWDLAPRQEVTSYRDPSLLANRMTHANKTLPCPKLRLWVVNLWEVLTFTPCSIRFQNKSGRAGTALLIVVSGRQTYLITSTVICSWYATSGTCNTKNKTFTDNRYSTCPSNPSWIYASTTCGEIYVNKRWSLCNLSL